MGSGIRDLGNMLPPRADITRISRLDSATSCIRVRQIAASRSPKQEAAIAVATVMTKNPGRWLWSSMPKKISPQMNMISSWTTATTAR